MNILIFIYSLDSGGAERVASSLANHWAASGWQVKLVSIAPALHDFYTLSPNVQRDALNLAGESDGVLGAALQNFRRVRALRRLIHQDRPDIVLALMTQSNILLALATFGVKGVVAIGSERVHPPQAPMGIVWASLRHLLYRRLDAVVTLTHESATWLRQHVPARRIAVIPNAATWPLPAGTASLALPPLADRRHCLLSVGRLCEQKGFDLLIDVFRRLINDFPDWRLVILGEGPDRKHLSRKIEALELGNHVRMPGRSGEVSQWYGCADVYVMSSRFEGFPNTLIEAMSHGLPVVSFDCPTGPRDIIRHEEDGLLVAAGDVLALEAALRRLMGSVSLRQQFGKKAVEVRQRYSMQSVSASWETLFRDLKDAP